RVMISIGGLYLGRQSLKSLPAFFPSVSSSMLGKPKGDVLVLGPDYARLTMVVVTVSDDGGMDFTNQIFVERHVVGQSGNPFVGLDCGFSLSLGTRMQLFSSIGLDCDIQLIPGKIGSLNS